MNNMLRDEYISVVFSAELLKFCRTHDLPYISADELILREGLTDYQFAWLDSYLTLWDSLID